VLAAAALDTLQRWFASDADQVRDDHVQAAFRERCQDLNQVVDAARLVWARMLDPADLQIRMPHDGYLKLFSLDTPRIGAYDYVLVDEAQDITAATYAIVRAQPGRQVYVGDPWQAIYGFRGAINALQTVRADATLHLTTSWRFGEGIASLANLLLSEFKHDPYPIVGRGRPRQTIFSVEREESFAYIGRTNASLLDAAVQHLDDARALVFVGGVASYRFDKLLDAYWLSRGLHSNVRDPYLRSFESFDALHELADASEDVELLSLVRAVSAYGNALPDLIDAIKRRAVDMPLHDAERSNAICFATAHKAKGLEFRQVHLNDDFVEFFDQSGRERAATEIEPEEINLVYVALTRARARLRICRSLMDWLNYRTDLKVQLRATALAG
jgi:superfamily I DNA/RNA helicase